MIMLYKSTLCTQSFCSSSPMHRSKAFGVRTRIKFLASFTLLRRFSSNFPAFSFSMSRKTENPRNWRWTFSKLQKTTYIKKTYIYCNKYFVMKFQCYYICPIIGNESKTFALHTKEFQFIVIEPDDQLLTNHICILYLKINHIRLKSKFKFRIYFLIH